MPRLSDTFPIFGISALGSRFFSIAPDNTAKNEGDTVTFTVTAIGFGTGTLYWTVESVSGTINNSDFSSPSNAVTAGGSVNITAGSGTFSLVLASDVTTEGTESFLVRLRESSTSGTIIATSSTVTVSDTSPAISYSAAPAAGSVNEGSSLTINVSTTSVANGTTLYWTVSRPEDFGTSSGSFTINNNAGSFTVTPTADATTEGAETFTVSIRTGSTSGTIVATTSSITINDTSAAPTDSNYGWFTGGLLNGSSAATSMIDRMDLNNDTSSSVTRTNLVYVVSESAGVGNFTNGWIAGGVSGSNLSRVERITYASDTSATSTRGRLVASRNALTGTGTTSDGWIAGGAVSGLERITYASDTNTAASRGPGFETLRPSFTAATTNGTFGWWSGSGNGASSVFRITYSSDTSAPSQRGNLTRTFATSSVGTGNTSFGYIGGGWPFSSVNRITYASDGVVAVVRFNMNQRRHFAASVRTNSSGWFGGGADGTASTPTLSGLERVDFASDTSMSVRGSLNTARRRLTATSGFA